MVVGYAHTNLAIINLVNFKLTYLADEDMDLFVRSTPGISDALISGIVSQGVFNNTYLVEYPIVRFTGLRAKKMLAPFRFVKYYKRYKHQYDTRLHNAVGEKKYDMLICPHFHCDAVFFADYFSRNNPKLRIRFIDEGTISICYTNAERSGVYVIPQKATERIKRVFTYLKLCRKHRKRVDKIEYLMGERKMVEDPLVSIVTLPPIVLNHKSQEVFTNLFSFSDVLNIYYQKRSIYCFAEYPSYEFPDYETFLYKLLNLIFEDVSPERCIVRLHPNQTAFKEKLKEEDGPHKMTFVDVAGDPIEAVFFNVDLKNKIFILRESTIMFLPKLMFESEAIIICTSRLLQRYVSDEFYKEMTDLYIDYLKDIYIDKTRIYAPNSFRELKMNIKEAYRKICHYGTNEFSD